MQSTGQIVRDGLAGDIEAYFGSVFDGSGVSSSRGFIVNFGDKVTRIPNYMFFSTGTAPKIGRAIISNSVESIGSEAFSNCAYLVSVNIGSGVQTIGRDAFHCCTNLQAINVAAANTSFVSINNVLYNKSVDTLILYPKVSGSFRVPTSVTKIGFGAFEYATNLTSITFPSVKTIESFAFNGCTGLMRVDLSKVTSIGEMAFYECSNLSDVIFGSEAIRWGNSAFGECNRISAIHVPSLEAYLSKSFKADVNSGLYLASKLYINGSLLVDAVIPSSVTYISSNCFANLTCLKTIYIPSSVKTISTSSATDSPFYRCASTLQIRCAAASKLSGWGSYWNYYSHTATLNVTWSAAS